jgi:gluconolactonase
MMRKNARVAIAQFPAHYLGKLNRQPSIPDNSSEVPVKPFFCGSLMTAFVFAFATMGPAAEGAKTDTKPSTKTKSVDAGDIKLNVPESWKQNSKVREPRIAEFEVPATGDDKEPGEFAVFFFGKQGAGSVKDNVKRWVGQVEEEGRKVRIVAGESTNGKYTLVDLTGAYNKSIGPPIAGKKKRLPNWRVINVLVANDGGDYFLKLDGPAKTIAAVEDDFRAAFGGKKESEKEQKAE